MARQNNLIWKEEWTVGHSELDSQHKRLVEIINELNTDEAEQNPKVYARILSDLTNYTMEHYQTEESYMREHQYPFIKRHLSAHRWFILQLSRYNFEFSHQVPTYAPVVYQFVANWLINHELREDMEYKAFIAKDFTKGCTQERNAKVRYNWTNQDTMKRSES